jgi:hypothetical protein
MNSIYVMFIFCLLGALSPPLFAINYYEAVLDRVNPEVKARLNIKEEWGQSQVGSAGDWFSGKEKSDHKYSRREIEQTLAVLFGINRVNNFLVPGGAPKIAPAIETFILSWDEDYKFTIEDLAQLAGIKVKAHEAHHRLDDYWYSNFYQGSVIEQVRKAHSNFYMLSTFLTWWRAFRACETVSLEKLRDLISTGLLRYESTADIEKFFQKWEEVVQEPLSLENYLSMVGYSNKSTSSGLSSQMDGATQFIEVFGGTVTKEGVHKISAHYGVTFHDVTALLANNDERDIDKLVDAAANKVEHKAKTKRRKNRLRDLVETVTEVPGFVLQALTGMDIQPTGGRTIIVIPFIGGN